MDTFTELEKLVHQELLVHFAIPAMPLLPPPAQRPTYNFITTRHPPPDYSKPPYSAPPEIDVGFDYEVPPLTRAELAAHKPLRIAEIWWRVLRARCDAQLEADFRREMEWAELREIGAAGLHWMRRLVFRAVLPVLELAADRGVFIGPPERHQGNGWGHVEERVAAILAGEP